MTRIDESVGMQVSWVWSSRFFWQDRQVNLGSEVEGNGLENVGAKGFLDAVGGDLKVAGITLNTDEASADVAAGNSSRSAAHRVVEDGLAFVGVGLD